MAVRPAVSVDPDAGIPDLIRRLADDSRRLAQDEARLAKLEMTRNLRDAMHGGLWLGLAFGAGVVALVALTIALATLVGRLLGNYWAGTLIVGAVEVVAAWLLVRSGLRRLASPSYTFAESREAARDTVDWVKTAGAR